ncbi:MAG: LysR family transcriptional regulator [Rhizobacter sp.]|jgi:DNA-binding transcriptional LysR family regulator|nr:LysR family transcriptional regulator [Rhizobacter sp.]
MDQLQAMRVFARVIDTGSFAGAARALDMSPAAVTRWVAELEAHIQTRLVNRTTRKLMLTETGEAYLERVRQILSDVDDANGLAHAATTEPRGHLRVLMPSPFAVFQLTRHLARFRKLYPRVTIDINAGGGLAESVNEEYDVTILLIGHRPLQGGFVARLLARTEILVCAAPAYLNARGRPSHPDELPGHECLIPALHGVPREWTMTARSTADSPTPTSVTITPHAAMTANSVETLFAGALAGLGIVGLPSFMVEDALAEGKLERVLADWKSVSYEIYAAMPSRKYLPARTRAFVDFLVRTFGGDDHDPWLARTAPALNPSTKADAALTRNREKAQ